MDGIESLSKSKTQIPAVAKSPKTDFLSLRNYLTYFSPVLTKIPFQNASFQLTKEHQNFIVVDPTGRLALISRFNKEVLAEKHLEDFSFSSLCISNDGIYVFTAGYLGIVNMIQLFDFQLVTSFRIGTSNINQIKAHKSDKLIVANDDGEVVL